MTDSLDCEDKNYFKKFWAIYSFLALFATIIVIINSMNLFIAIFFLIWSFIFYLMIFFLITYNENQELEEVMIKKGGNKIGTEIINGSYTMIKEKNELRIENNESHLTKGIIFLFVFAVVTSALLFFLGILFTLFFVMILCVPFIIAYQYYRNRITVCSINKVSNIILLKEITPKYKILKNIIFPDVETFEYFLTDPMTSTYSLKFTDIHGVKITVFKGEEEEYFLLYEDITNFLELKFPYKEEG